MLKNNFEKYQCSLDRSSAESHSRKYVACVLLVVSVVRVSVLSTTLKASQVRYSVLYYTVFDKQNIYFVIFHDTHITVK